MPSSRHFAYAIVFFAISYWGFLKVQAQEVSVVVPAIECQNLSTAAERKQCWLSSITFECLLLADPDEKTQCSFDRVSGPIGGQQFPGGSNNPPGGISAYQPPDDFNAQVAPMLDEFILRQDGLVPLPDYAPSRVDG